ncbi:pyridoxal 5'-phosphate synthase-like subunit PDX1.2 [Juglans microcarpa x Juglans regia]|uniref:pyridoxal 5'-phosphate synthase-like subunit PDX1.2 n=1 Tax=Juglans microcarpa x Juglans regia TaxID=2249226 RepID=UPI001B7DCC3C|nr:pyridoxal 5'-phosphate synthase-like subunit PDX1.2 [Juglans microcarpa x Juglans regia]
MARARVGHFVEAQILESIGVDYIYESEALAIVDEENFINKHNFRCPFVCGCQNLGEVLRRIREGAAMIRTQGDLSGSGNIAKTVKKLRIIMGEVRILNNMDEDEVFAFSKKIATPYDLMAQTKLAQKLLDSLPTLVMVEAGMARREAFQEAERHGKAKKRYSGDYAQGSTLKKLKC